MTSNMLGLGCAALLALVIGHTAAATDTPDVLYRGYAIVSEPTIDLRSPAGRLPACRDARYWRDYWRSCRNRLSAPAHEAAADLKSGGCTNSRIPKTSGISGRAH